MLIIHRKSIMLMHRPQTPQPGFGSITLLQKFTPISKSWIRACICEVTHVNMLWCPLTECHPVMLSALTIS